MSKGLRYLVVGAVAVIATLATWGCDDKDKDGYYVDGTYSYNSSTKELQDGLWFKQGTYDTGFDYCVSVITTQPYIAQKQYPEKLIVCFSADLLGQRVDLSDIPYKSYVKVEAMFDDNEVLIFEKKRKSTDVEVETPSGGKIHNGWVEMSLRESGICSVNLEIKVNTNTVKSSFAGKVRRLVYTTD